MYGMLNKDCIVWIVNEVVNDVCWMNWENFIVGLEMGFFWFLGV